LNIFFFYALMNNPTIICTNRSCNFKRILVHIKNHWRKSNAKKENVKIQLHQKKNWKIVCVIFSAPNDYFIANSKLIMDPFWQT